MSTTVAPLTPEENLEWERTQAPRAGLAAILAGLLGIVGLILSNLTYQDSPHIFLTDGLRDAAGQGVPGGGLRTPLILFLDDHKGLLLGTAICLGVASALMAPMLGYLFRAAVGRRPQTPSFALYLGLIGPVIVGVAQIVLQIALVSSVGDFASGSDRSTGAAHDALSGPVLGAAQILIFFGTFAVALAYIVITLNAMRAGLLSRFMGVLGIIVGVLFVFSSGSGVGAAGIGQGTQIVQTFWLVAIGWLILGRWPSGVPQAWLDGKAHVPPTQQELRAARERAERGEDEPEPEEVTPAAPATPGRKKRKRR